MRVQLIYTDNEEALDLVDTVDTLINDEGRYEFDNLVFTGKKTDLGNGKLQFVSEIGYTYLFKLL